MAESPSAKRFTVHVVPPHVVPVSPAPHAAFSRAPLAAEGQGGGYPISVVTAPVTDTCKEVVDGLVRATVPRETLAELRGPWLVTGDGLADALSRALGREAEITDMGSLCEVAGVRVHALPAR